MTTLASGGDYPGDGVDRLNPESPVTADPPPPATPAILLSREQAAAALSISTAHLDRLERRGLIGPQAIRLGERLVVRPRPARTLGRRRLPPARPVGPHDRGRRPAPLQRQGAA